MAREKVTAHIIEHSSMRDARGFPMAFNIKAGSWRRIEEATFFYCEVRARAYQFEFGVESESEIKEVEEEDGSKK